MSNQAEPPARETIWKKVRWQRRPTPYPLNVPLASTTRRRSLRDRLESMLSSITPGKTRTASDDNHRLQTSEAEESPVSPNADAVSPGDSPVSPGGSHVSHLSTTLEDSGPQTPHGLAIIAEEHNAPSQDAPLPSALLTHGISTSGTPQISAPTTPALAAIISANNVDDDVILPVPNDWPRQPTPEDESPYGLAPPYGGLPGNPTTKPLPPDPPREYTPKGSSPPSPRDKGKRPVSPAPEVESPKTPELELSVLDTQVSDGEYPPDPEPKPEERKDSGNSVGEKIVQSFRKLSSAMRHRPRHRQPLEEIHGEVPPLNWKPAPEPRPTRKPAQTTPSAQATSPSQPTPPSRPAPTSPGHSTIATPPPPDRTTAEHRSLLASHQDTAA